MLTNFLELSLISMVALLGFIGKNRGRPLLLFAGFGFMFFGWDYWTTAQTYSIVAWLAGFVMCALAFTERGMDK